MPKPVAEVVSEIERCVGEPYFRSVGTGLITINGVLPIVRTAQVDNLAGVLAGNEGVDRAVIAGGQREGWRPFGLFALTPLRAILVMTTMGSIYTDQAVRDGTAASFIYWNDLVRFDLRQEKGPGWFTNLRLWRLTLVGVDKVGTVNVNVYEKYCGEEAVSALVQAINIRLAAVRGATNSRLANSASLAGELERLSALRLSGALTEDEFARAKAKLIGGE
ncbi:MAG: SHOCT domain-containing protein [Chloroflexi bacterium]|nr:SHOCT domain-containing protein [Chloroflexota bacterium]